MLFPYLLTNFLMIFRVVTYSRSQASERHLCTRPARHEVRAWGARSVMHTYWGFLFFEMLVFMYLFKQF